MEFKILNNGVKMPMIGFGLYKVNKDDSYRVVSDAIKVSCNCYFYEVGRRMGIDNLVKYCQMFGLGNKTGVELYGESKGMIAGANKNMDWYLGDTLSAVIGQSYNSFTPVQLANYIATLANGGTYFQLKNVIVSNVTLSMISPSRIIQPSSYNSFDNIASLAKICSSNSCI